MITHMHHPDFINRTLCGWAIYPNRIKNSQVVPHGSKRANCELCLRLYNSGQKVVNL